MSYIILTIAALFSAMALSKRQHHKGLDKGLTWCSWAVCLCEALFSPPEAVHDLALYAG